MEPPQELIDTLRAGHRVNLMLAPHEPLENARKLIARLEEMGFTIEHQVYTVDGRVGYVIWSVEHRPTKVVGY